MSNQLATSSAWTVRDSGSRPRSAGIRTCVALLAVLATYVACAPARQASFALTEVTCAGNPSVCEQKCRQEEAFVHSDECDWIAVKTAEDIIMRGNVGQIDPRGLHPDLTRICQDGIARACAADQRLAAGYAAADAADHSKTEAAQAHAVIASEFAAHIAEVEKEARDALAALGAEGSPVAKQAANLAVRFAVDARKCTAPPCPSLDQAAAQVQLVQNEVSRVLAQRSQATQAQQTTVDARAAVKAAYQTATDACTADPAACQRDCAADAASYACVALAVLLETGDPRVGGVNHARARDVAKKACTGCNTMGCAVVATQAEQANTCGDLATCRQYCDAGFADGCAELGTLYVNGEGVPRSYPTANALFLRACDMGSARGCFKLAAAHIEGLGMPRNAQAGRDPIVKACDLGELRACMAYCELLGMQRMTDVRCARPIPGPAPPAAASVTARAPGVMTETTCCPDGLQAGGWHFGCACGDSSTQAPQPTTPGCGGDWPSTKGSACIWRCGPATTPTATSNAPAVTTGTQTLTGKHGETITVAQDREVSVTDSAGKLLSQSTCLGTPFSTWAALFARVQPLVVAQDYPKLAALLRFPMRTPSGAIVHDQQEFLGNPRTVFEDGIRAEIANAEPRAVFCRNGATIANGVLWASDDGQGHIQIAGVSRPSPQQHL